MSEIAKIAAAIFKRAGKRERFVIAIAGPPGAGKSTLAQAVRDLMPDGSAVVVPMDGFHYDDAVLERLGLRHRKGAPETFDFAGYEHLLRRLRAREADIAIPVFDRVLEMSRAAAALVPAEVKFILTEGNYLLLDEAPWDGLASVIDFGVYIDVPREELERRLLRRWTEHDRTDGAAWVASVDMPNVDRVLSRRRIADLVV